jgi:adenosine deaminase
MHDFIRTMPKVELHVHLIGAIQPETLLRLAQQHGVALPADTVEGLHQWYTFTDFAHFVEIYLTISDCIRTADDVELIAREFLAGQAAQNIVYTEVTHTPFYIAKKGIPYDQQLAAIRRARAWAEETLGVTLRLIIDIPREISVPDGNDLARWVGSVWGDTVLALGLGGPEIGNPPEKFAEAFAYAQQIGLPSVPHAGETEGPASIWGALRSLNAVRIGHGVRCLEDPALVAELRDRQIPLEVSPTSNVCLHVAPDFAHHPLPRLIEEGLYVTLNSDDPAMFNTTLTEEYRRVADCFGYDAAMLQKLVMNAARAALLPVDEKATLVARLEREFAVLNGQVEGV